MSVFCILSGCTKAALYPVHFFRDYVSQVDGNRCPMHPSCSSYAVEAIKKHGALIGWVMACDRLMRCGRDEKTRSDRIQLDDGYYCHDPVSNNDFWFDKSESEWINEADKIINKPSSL